MDITRNKDRSFTLRQPFLIKRILDKVGLVETTGGRETPIGNPLLHKDCNGAERKMEWHHHSIIGMLSYLQGSMRPDISMVMHQCSRFSNQPMLSHEKAVKWKELFLNLTKIPAFTNALTACRLLISVDLG